MTFKEYLRQQDPKRHPIVFLEKSDCYVYHEGELPPPGKAFVDLEIHGEHFQYILTFNSNILWTMDQDGNPKSPSCFQLK